jgi:hypothetical protein
VSAFGHSRADRRTESLDHLSDPFGRDVSRDHAHDLGHQDPVRSSVSPRTPVAQLGRQQDDAEGQRKAHQHGLSIVHDADRSGRTLREAALDSGESRRKGFPCAFAPDGADEVGPIWVPVKATAGSFETSFAVPLGLRE